MVMENEEMVMDKYFVKSGNAVSVAFQHLFPM